MPVFGPPPMSAADLAEKISSGSDLAWDWGERPIKNLLFDLGGGKNRVFCRKKGLAGGIDVQEWLLDLVWLDKTSMTLAVESEWSRAMAHRLDDFEKLMFVQSPLKLFIYATGNASENDDVRRELAKYMQDFSQNVEGEEYLLMEVRDGQAHFFHYTVPNTGSVTNVEFGPLDLKQGTSA